MAKISLKAFKGIRPQLAAQLLDTMEAQTAENCKITSGELRPWLNEVVDSDLELTDLIRTVYLYRTNYWLEWSSDVNVVPGPIINDQNYRFYYTGNGLPKKSNFTLATTGSGAMPVKFLPIAAPMPKAVITASNTGGGTGEDRTVVWVWTVLNTFGEESAPSVASNIITGKQGDTVNLSGMNLTWQAGTTYELNDWVVPTTPNTFMYICTLAGTSHSTEPTWGTTRDADTTDNLAKWRCYDNTISAKYIYRLNMGEATARYQYVGQITAIQTTYSDSKTDTELGEILRTGYGDYAYWSPPPQGLSGVVSLPGGVLAGFVGKDVYFSEPYYPHAWPEDYVLTMDATVVALAVMENNLVAATDSFPYIITGSHPESMTPIKMPTSLPCVSKRGIAAFPKGVLYPSNSGLILVSEGRADLTTDGYFRKEEWAKFFPTTMNGAFHDGKYFAFFDEGALGGGALVVDFKNSYITTIDLGEEADTLYAPAVYVDQKTDVLYYVKQVLTSTPPDPDVYASEVYQWEGDSSQAFSNFIWKTKQYNFQTRLRFNYARIYFTEGDFDTFNALLDAYNNVIARNLDRLSSENIIHAQGPWQGYEIGTLPLAGTYLEDVPTEPVYSGDKMLSLKAYCNNVLVSERLVYNERPFRLGQDIRQGREWEFILEGNVDRLQQIDLASSMDELKQEQSEG
jgi:hypothetical protein